MNPRVRVFIKLEPMIYEGQITKFKSALELLIRDFGGRQPEEK